MRRVSRVVLWGGLAFALTMGAAPAQLLNEIIRGAAIDVPSNFFDCDGVNACELGYRIYPSVDSRDVNGPANPVDGVPRYNRKFDRYQADAQTTANFPGANSAPDKEWYIVWDGQTGGGTADHVGWYGTQAQLVGFGEIGNSFSFNCLPVVAQEACFAALSSGSSHGTLAADGSPIDPVGGVSPIPIPVIDENALSTISYSWDPASNNTSRDFAQPPITGYTLYLVGCPETPPTDDDFRPVADEMGNGIGVPVASVEFGASTSVTLDRGTLNATPGLEGAATYAAAIRMDYFWTDDPEFDPPAEPLFSEFSGNSALSGVCVTGSEPGDAPAHIDIETVCYEIRTDGFGGRFLVVTLKMAQTPVSVSQRRYELDLGDLRADLIALPTSAARNKSGNDFLLRATSNFDAGDLVANSSIDNVNGVVTLVIDADAVEAAEGSSFRLAGRAKQPAARDEFDLGVISLTGLE